MYSHVLLVMLILIPEGFCDECRYTVRADSGELQSPNYNFQYDNNLHCTWEITSASGGNLSLYFDAFQIEFDAKCERDSLKISSGENVLQKACGTSIQGKTFFSPSGVFNLLFVTDGNRGNYRGFHASFKVGNPDVGTYNSTGDSSFSVSLEAATNHHPQSTVSAKQSTSFHGDPYSSGKHITVTTLLPKFTVSEKQSTSFPGSRSSSMKHSTVTRKKSSTEQQTTAAFQRDSISSEKHTTAPVTIIIGATVGTCVGIAIIIGLVIFYIKKKGSVPKANIPNNLNDNSIGMNSLEPSNIQEKAAIELNNVVVNQDTYAVPMKKRFRQGEGQEEMQEEVYRDNLTEYDSLHTSRPKINTSRESNIYKLTTAAADNVYDTNKKQTDIENENYDSMGDIKMSWPDANELYDTTTGIGHVNNDVILSEDGYGTML